MRGGGLEVHYALLGELKVTRDDGTDLPISQARFRALLAIFLVHPNKVLTADKILQLRGTATFLVAELTSCTPMYPGCAGSSCRNDP